MSRPELAWFKSSHSGTEGDDCVEVATRPSTIHVRDSKLPASPELSLSPVAWAPFIAQVGDFVPDSL